ncbi:MAG: hypothetical protein ACOC0Q_03540, partial [Wenzhouxiangella sp.]
MEQMPGFTNRSIDPAELPDYRAVPLHQVAPNFGPYAVLVAVLTWLVLALAVLVAPRLPFVDVSLPATSALLPLAAALWFGAVAWLDARRRGWALTTQVLLILSIV